MEARKEKTLLHPPGLNGLEKLLAVDDTTLDAEAKKEVLDKKLRTMFNYFIAGVGYDIDSKGNLRIKVVHYDPKKPFNPEKPSESEIQLRVPGGSFDPNDLLEAIKNVKLPAHKKADLEKQLQMEVGYAKIDKLYIAEDHPTRAKYAERFFAITRSFFDPNDIESLRSLLSDCMMETLRREMSDEISGKFTSATLVGERTFGDGHTKYAVVLNDLESPEVTSGSGDADIVDSLYMSVQSVVKELWGGHSVPLRTALLHLRKQMSLQKEKHVVGVLNDILA
jgi:hypothetical protein